MSITMAAMPGVTKDMNNMAVDARNSTTMSTVAVKKDSLNMGQLCLDDE